MRVVRFRLGAAGGWRRTALAVALALLATLARPSAGEAQGGADEIPLRPRTVVVVPFVNISEDPDIDWFGTGIAQTVTADLEQLPDLSVIGREGLARDLSDTTDDMSAREVARERGIAWFVDGGFQRLGDQLRITARIVSVRTGATHATVKVDGRLDEVFALQDRIVAELAPGFATITGAVDLGAAIPDGADVMPTGRQTPVTGGEGPTADTQSAFRPRRGAGQVAPDGRVSPAVLPDGVTAPAPASAGTSREPSALGLPFAIIGPPPPAAPATIARDAQGRVTIRAVPVVAPLRIDGRLEEAFYGSTPPLSDFIQNEPTVDAPATEKTEVWVGYDSANVYVTVRAWESEPDRMVVNEMRRDSQNVWRNESVSFMFDTYYDRRNAVSFDINAIGGRGDSQITDERTYNSDWNPVWDLAVGTFDGGWTAEAAIPFKSLRYRPGRAQVWGFNARRVNRWKNEISFLARVSEGLGSGGIARASQAATLVGIEAPSGSRNVEIKPYVISDLASDATATPRISNDAGGDVGLDVKYGLTQNLTADLTYNTDFAQVEADQQQVNLTRFSLFFPEKREFFLENQGVFRFGGAQGRGAVPFLFQSRRIGLDRGRQIPIQAGGRLTGRLGAFDVGVINIQADKDPAVGAQATNFSVVRVRRDILRRSSIGALVTRRSVALGGVGSNEAYGLDGRFAFFQNLTFDTYWAQTRTGGVTGDDTSYRAQLTYAGDRYGLIAHRLVVGKHFNPEVGFLFRNDIAKYFTQLRFSPRPAAIKRVRKLSVVGQVDYFENGAGQVVTRELQGEFIVEFENSDMFNLAYLDSYEFLEAPFEIALGVTIPVGSYRFGTASTSFTLGQQRAVSGTAFVERGSFWGGDKTAVGYRQGRVNLTSQLSVEPSLSFNRVSLPFGSFTSNLVGSRVTYTITPLMFVSGLVQYNSSNDAVDTNLRLRWEYRPGSELFVVYNETRDTTRPGFPGLKTRALIVKINRLFRF